MIWLSNVYSDLFNERHLGDYYPHRPLSEVRRLFEYSFFYLRNNGKYSSEVVTS